MEHVIYGAVIGILLILLIIEKRKPKCRYHENQNENQDGGDCSYCRGCDCHDDYC